MSKLVLYGVKTSPPVRACLLTLKALDLPFEQEVVNVFQKGPSNEKVAKNNPQHTVPVLNDNGAWLWDSHAICGYLVSKYGKDDSLYPKDLLKRAVVDQRMYFDASVLFMPLRNVVVSFFRKNITVVKKEQTESIIEAYDFVEKFLGDNSYITGESLTIADFCCAATVTSLRGIVEIEIARFPKITAWLDHMSKLPYYEEANGKGAKQLVGFLKSKLTEIVV